MNEPYPADLYPGCPCLRCDRQTWPKGVGGHPFPIRMSLCPSCGDKRCPGAVRHDRHRDATPTPRTPESADERGA